MAKEEPKKTASADSSGVAKEELEKKNKEYLEGWKRERADFLNYKKDEMERIDALIKYAKEGQILKMLPILDNFALAEKNIPEELKKDEHVKGILQISKQIKEFLKAQGVDEIKTAPFGVPQGKVAERVMFDPNFMESVGEVEIKDAKPGEVVEEVQKGYTIGGRVLRVAKVKIVK